MHRPPARLLASVAILRRAGRRRLLDHHVRLIVRHHRIDRAPTPRRVPTSNGGRRWSPGASATAPIRPIRTPRSATPRRCAPSASARRPPPCSNRRRSTIRTTAPCSAPMAGRWPTTAVSSRRSTCSTARTRQDQPDWRILSVQGAVLDQMGRHADAQRLLRQRAAADAGRAVGAVQSRAVLRAVEESAAGRGDAAPRRRAARAPSRRCGRILRWSSACRAASRRPRRSRAATCRPTRPPANVAYLRQMLAQQNDGRKISAARRWRRRPARSLNRGLPVACFSTGAPTFCGYPGSPSRGSPRVPE